MATNASFVYYRSNNFGKDLDEKSIIELLGVDHNTLSKIEICGIPYFNYFKFPDAMSFSLKTIYPGLVIGSGYNHPAQDSSSDHREHSSNQKKQTSDFQFGFYFDYTTGMPVIPGSTVKGVLKSVFPKEGDSGEIKNEKLKYVNGLLRKDSLLTQGNWEKLFEKGNIFFDAYVSGTPDNGKIFAEDYITPHKDQFKNPIPIRFLKIAPDVTFDFQFKLKDSDLGDGQIITASEKLALFKKILLGFGIGAKRNVGYGNFTL